MQARKGLQFRMVLSMLQSYQNPILIALVIITIQDAIVTTTDIGVVYSPLVRKSDRTNTQEYSREIVKVMLNVVLDAGYRSVTTYGVGSPNRPYDNDSISDCSSFVHTAMAAAEINKERNSVAITVFQGLYNSTYENQVNCEIEVGLEIAHRANSIFSDTVPAIIYPSQVNFHDLIDNGFINSKIKNVAARVRNLKLKFGVRVLNCQDIQTRTEWKVKDVVSNYDFIICLENPDENKFKFGVEGFENSVVLILMQAEEFLENKFNISSKSVELILETGWPGDPALGPPNAVQNLIEYWGSVTDWARKNGRRVFLHEAFDTPWKDEHPEWPLGAHFGRWEYNVKEPNLLSKNAYVLKKDPVRTFFSSFGIPQIGLLSGIIVLFSVITMVVLLYKRVSRIEATASTFMLNEQEVKMFFEGIPDEDHDGEYIGDIWEKSPYDFQLEILKDQIKIDQSEAGLLGKGQFGCVYSAELFVYGSCKRVAVKMTRACCAQSEIKSLLSEIKTLMYVGSHNHICSLLGACTKEIQKGTVYFAMELCEFGSLEGYLRKNKDNFKDDLDATTRKENIYVKHSIYELETFTMSALQLVRWSYEIASAMHFISSKNVIHSDLAARNVLLTNEYVTKITDFGLSRRFLEDEPNYCKTGMEPLPWKWLAPESLEFKRFSTKSDVWAYAVTVWEMFSLGLPPKYASVRSWNELLAYLKAGERLEQPAYAPDDIYKIMLDCWHLEPVDRPSFEHIMESLVSVIDSDYRDLSE